MKYLKALFFAIRFLTIIPLGRSGTPPAKNVPSLSLIFFPIVGLILGLILSGVYEIERLASIPPLISSIILVISLIILTRGLHLDGLSDMLDAIGSFKDRESALNVMRDPHVGAFGVMGIISAVLLKFGLIYFLIFENKNVSLALILTCVASRWTMAMTIWLFPYARYEGKGKIFFEEMNLAKFAAATLICAAILTVPRQTYGFVILGASGIFTLIFAYLSNKKFGGITGDILGATIELNEILILALCATL